VVGRSGDRRVRTLARGIDHPATRACVLAERAFSAALGGDCNLPLGTLATVHGSSLSLIGEVLTPDGRVCLRGTRAGPSSSPERVGTKLGMEMRDRGAHGLMPRRRR
jgi:hydroxymethylbilane synthase